MKDISRVAFTRRGVLKGRGPFRTDSSVPGYKDNS